MTMTLTPQAALTALVRGAVRNGHLLLADSVTQPGVTALEFDTVPAAAHAVELLTAIRDDLQSPLIRGFERYGKVVVVRWTAPAPDPATRVEMPPPAGY